MAKGSHFSKIGGNDKHKQRKNDCLLIILNTDLKKEVLMTK